MARFYGRKLYRYEFAGNVFVYETAADLGVFLIVFFSRLIKRFVFSRMFGGEERRDVRTCKNDCFPIKMEKYAK